MRSFAAWKSSLLSAVQPKHRPAPQDLARGRPNINEIVPGLYISDLFTACSETELARLGITHVLSVLDFRPAVPPHVVAVHITLEDRTDADILSYFDTTTTFIRDALAAAPQNRVLVHCLMGVSRSATVVCAYLVATNDMTAPQALAAVKAKRAVVNPNYGFQRQLHKYAARCRGEPEASVDQGTGSELTIAERIRLLTDSVPQDFERKANADEIVPRLYLSDLFTARSEADLERLGITHVLSVLDFHPVIPPHVVAVHIPLADRSDANILEHLDATTTFIRDALAAAPQNRVLVHCLMGISRSATVVCAYLVATTNMSPAQALAAVQAKRAVVNPNYSFQRQLRKYSARCCGEPEVLADPGTGSGSGSTVAERIRLLSGDEDATVSVAITSSTSASTRSTVASTSTDLVVDSRA